MMERFDLIVSRPGKDGKTFWHRIGTMFSAKEGDGYAIKLDSLPLPNERGEVWIKASRPREKEDRE